MRVIPVYSTDSHFLYSNILHRYIFSTNHKSVSLIRAFVRLLSGAITVSDMNMGDSTVAISSVSLIDHVSDHIITTGSDPCIPIPSDHEI